MNAVEYLADVLPRLARGMRAADAAELLPAAWRDRRAIERLRHATQDTAPKAAKPDARQPDTS